MIQDNKKETKQCKFGLGSEQYLEHHSDGSLSGELAALHALCEMQRTRGEDGEGSGAGERSEMNSIHARNPMPTCIKTHCDPNPPDANTLYVCVCVCGWGRRGHGVT